MKMKSSLYFLFTILAFTSLQCSQKEKDLLSSKFHPNDPFQATMVKSQFFRIDGKQDEVLEGQEGTVIVLPKDCFMNSEGETVTENIQIELAEALSLDQMLLSNLTTTTNERLLETDGMLYFNASANGEQLQVNPNKPVYIEIPTKKRKANMMAYKGVREENGNMDWVEPKALENFLVTVDMDLLNFYPAGFVEEVEANLPFRGRKTADKQFLDSLYYALSVYDGTEYSGLSEDTEVNETYYETYDSSYEYDTVDSVAVQKDCGVDPAIIKVIRSDSYQNSLISTRAFETRLQTIFKTCRNDIIELYILNLEKDLYVLDSMAAAALVDHYAYEAFHTFYKQGLTNVKGANPYTGLLKEHYQQRLRKVKEELEQLRQHFTNSLTIKKEATKELVEEYKEVLRKREKVRMETYGFEWTDTGWINIDRGISPKGWGPQGFQLIVNDADNYDRVYSYLVYTSIKSIYRLNSIDNRLFYPGNEQQKEMLMPTKELAVVISIGYKGGASFLAVQEFETVTTTDLTLSLKPSSNQEIKKAIAAYNDYGEENSIDKDLLYMERLVQERKNNEKLLTERRIISKLWEIVNSCCIDDYRGGN